MLTAPALGPGSSICHLTGASLSRTATAGAVGAIPVRAPDGFVLYLINLTNQIDTASNAPRPPCTLHDLTLTIPDLPPKQQAVLLSFDVHHRRPHPLPIWPPPYPIPFIFPGCQSGLQSSIYLPEHPPNSE